MRAASRTPSLRPSLSHLLPSWLVQRVRAARADRPFERLRRGHIPLPRALTCAGKTDGAGAQLHAMLSTIGFCRTFGVPYLHTPLSDVQHVTSPDDITSWESFLSLQDFQDFDDQGYPERVDFRDYLKNPEKYGVNVLAVVDHLHDYTDRHLSCYDAVLPALRTKFQSKHGRQRRRLAVHVRRGDVGQSAHTDRYTSNAWVKTILGAALGGDDPTDCEVLLVSQGLEADFADIVSAYPQTQLLLNIDPIASVRVLATADTLVLAKSSFSYLAGLLSSGQVIYEPFWHPPLPHWWRVEGSHDRARLVAPGPSR